MSIPPSFPQFDRMIFAFFHRCSRPKPGDFFWLCFFTLGFVVLVSRLHAQTPYFGGRYQKILVENCSLTEESFERVGRGETVINAVKTHDKKEIALCGLVVLHRTRVPSVNELRRSLSQSANRTILASGSFRDSIVKEDLDELTIDQTDQESLAKCTSKKCEVLVSSALRLRISESVLLSPTELEALYKQDITNYVRSYRSFGKQAGRIYGDSFYFYTEDKSQLTSDYANFSKFDPRLWAYLKSYPQQSLPGAETEIAWSKVNFGLKAVLIISSTTFYSPADSPYPVIANQQIYASRYINGSMVMTTVIPDSNGRLYLVVANISRSDALGGLFSSVKRSIVASDGTERLKEMLDKAKTHLDSGYTDDLPRPTAPEFSSWTQFTRKSTSAAVFATLIIAVAVVTLRYLHSSRWRG